MSSLGKVKSLDYHRTGKEKVIKPGKHKDGYLRVSLHKNSKRKWVTVHRLVATAFIPNPENKPCIDHLNTIKTDNRACNLRWVTHKENSNNPISRKHFFDNIYIAGKHYNSKAVYQYSLDDKFIRKWDCMMDIERELGIGHQNISKCCLGKYKTAYNYKWKHA